MRSKMLPVQVHMRKSVARSGIETLALLHELIIVLKRQGQLVGVGTTWIVLQNSC